MGDRTRSAVVLRELREACGLTQDRWAAFVGVSRKTVQRWESGAAVPDAVAEASIADLCVEHSAWNQAGPGVASRSALAEVLASARRDAGQTTVGDGAAERVVGREGALSAVRAALGAERVVVLTGPGGVGKTTVARAIAAERRREVAVVFVELASIGDESQVLDAVAHACGARQSGHSALAESVAGALGARPTLLVLDAFEHVVDAGPIVRDLVDRSAGLAVLMTSRVRPRGFGYRVVPIDPLDHESALELFVARAREVSPDVLADGSDLDAVRRICARLDGLPLAIELAAARLQLLTPAGLLARSDHLLELLSGGRGERSDHDALRSMLGWSYGLLSEPAQRTLCRLACFAGAFAVEAAESVVGDLDGGSVLDALGELVDHSMLRLTRTGGTVRLVLLDTIREFAEELLSTTGERTDVEQRHDEWYAALSARAAREVRGAGQRDAIARLDEDRADIISTIVCAADRGDDVLVCRLAISMAPYWDVCGELSQARRWLDRAAMDATPTRLRATAGTWAAYFAMLQGDYNAAEDHARHALALYADDPESVGVAYAQLMLGQSHAERGDLDAAADLLHAATTGFTDHDDRWGLARALNTQAEIAYIREDCTSALELHTAALGNFDDIGDEYSKAYVLTGLGNVQLKLGAIAEAAATARAALAWALETNNRFQIAAAAELCARTAMQENKTNDAERLRRLAQLLRSAIGAAPTARYRSNLHDIDRSPAGRPLTPAGVNPTETADLLAWAATWTDNA